MVNWFKLDVNILNDEKIKVIRKQPDGDAIFILWVGFLSLAMKSPRPGIIEIAEGVPFSQDDFATFFDIKLKTVERGLSLFKKYNMIAFSDNKTIELVNFCKHQNTDKITHFNEQNKERQKRFRQSKSLPKTGDDNVTHNVNSEKESNVTDNVTDNVTGGVAVTLPITLRNGGDIDIDIDKDLDKDLDKDKELKKEKTFCQTSDEVRLSELLLNKIQNSNPGFKKPNIQKWAGHVDRLIRIDKKTPQEIEQVIDWCQSNDFWQTNILSTDKLRQKYDQLNLKRLAENKISGEGSIDAWARRKQAEMEAQSCN